MLAVPVLRRARESVDHDQRSHRSNHANHISQNLFAIPFLQSLFSRKREAEVESAGEILLSAVQLARRQQLLGADYSEAFPQFRPDAVLPAFAAIERQVSRARSLPAGEIGEQLGALVIGVRGGV